jgi:hypothetical protein
MDDTQFQADDLVYVDPAARQVVGRVTFDKSEKPNSLPYPKGENGRATRKYYPFGRYESMCRIYRLDGVSGKGGSLAEGDGASLDDVLPRALSDDL